MVVEFPAAMNLVADLASTLASVSQALDAVGARWAVGGSFASTIHGEPRLTNDIDIVAALRLEHAQPLQRALGARFHTDEAVIRESIKSRQSFNLIDEQTFFKVDIFVPEPGPLGEGQLDRRQSRDLAEAGCSIFVLAPEDIVLQKLRWFELGNRVAQQQWRDLVAVVRLSSSLDLAYMHSVAATGHLVELLELALREGAQTKR